MRPPIHDRSGHVCIPLLVEVNRVRVRQAQNLRDLGRVDQVLDIDFSTHVPTLRVPTDMPPPARHAVYRSKHFCYFV